MSGGIRDQSRNCMFYVVVCSTSKDILENDVEQWRRGFEERGLNISRKKTEKYSEDKDSGISMQGKN